MDNDVSDDSSEYFTAPGAQPPPKKPVRLLLKDRKSTQRTMGRLLQRVANKEIDLQTARCLIYGINTHLGYMKLEIETDLQDRIEKLEQMVKELQL